MQAHENFEQMNQVRHQISQIFNGRNMSEIVAALALFETEVLRQMTTEQRLEFITVRKGSLDLCLESVCLFDALEGNDNVPIC